MPILAPENIDIYARDRVNLSVPFGMKERLEALRYEKRARSVNAVVVEALEEYLEAQNI